MKTITVAGKPHLCLFATRSFTPGEEITYNYGDSEWPWRCKNIAETDALVSAKSVLAEKDQMQPEELHPQFSREAAHESTEDREAIVSITSVSLLTSPHCGNLLPAAQESLIQDQSPVLSRVHLPLLDSHHLFSLHLHHLPMMKQQHLLHLSVLLW
ncbi:hypothetical protein AOLI_G00286960 [Acnodon oligacanthus]